ncbi:MAG: UPF0175 family protein [Phycisphaerales bacterium]
MTLSVQLSPEIESLLKRINADPSEVLKASALVDLYRRGLLTHHQLGTAMGLSRFDTDVLLKRHGVPLEIDPATIDAEAERILRGRAA